MGSVSTNDAQVTGGLEVKDARARLLSNASVTAYDHTARIQLDRGGQVLVCATSAFHLLRSGNADSLLFGLDRGAIEVLSSTRAQDVLLTPDFRFTMSEDGVLDLRVRVTRNGDTCVENRGSNAPTLQVAETFGSATYRLLPNQHVLFEHGSLKEVVDNERSPCGCPVDAPAALAATPTLPGTSQRAEAEHPFPAAQSQDLAPATAPHAAAPPSGTPQTQVSASLAFNPNAPVRDSTTEVPAATAGAGAASSAPATVAAPPPSPPGAHDIVHAIGHFFHRLFAGKPKPAVAQ